MKTVASVGLLVVSSLFLGCAMCANPHDSTYNAYGGLRPSTELSRGRVGSVLDPVPGVLTTSASAYPTIVPYSDSTPEPLPSAIEPPPSTNEDDSANLQNDNPTSPSDESNNDLPELPDLDPNADETLPDLPNLEEISIPSASDLGN